MHMFAPTRRQLESEAIERHSAEHRSRGGAEDPSNQIIGLLWHVGLVKFAGTSLIRTRFQSMRAVARPPGSATNGILDWLAAFDSWSGRIIRCTIRDWHRRRRAGWPR